MDDILKKVFDLVEAFKAICYMYLKTAGTLGTDLFQSLVLGQVTWKIEGKKEVLVIGSNTRLWTCPRYHVVKNDAVFGGDPASEKTIMNPKAGNGYLNQPSGKALFSDVGELRICASYLYLALLAGDVVSQSSGVRGFLLKTITDQIGLPLKAEVFKRDDKMDKFVLLKSHADADTIKDFVAYAYATGLNNKTLWEGSPYIQAMFPPPDQKQKNGPAAKRVAVKY